MNTTKAPMPPRWARAFLRWYCRPSLLEDLEGDLNEYFDRNVRIKGVRRARWIYAIDVLKFLRIYTLRRPRLFNPIISWLMIGSYIKTTRRNMVRNKLFSFINIFGLSISMSVGLLVIAFMTDLRSYDDFHENKHRIYRVTTHDYRPGQPGMKLASTSTRAGKEIAASVSGVESLTLMRRGFGGDATVDDALIPVSGLWADQNFLKVFSFTMLEGDPATALKEPYAIVLTEKAASRLFGLAQAMGKSVKLGTDEYVVTGILKDLPKLSHLQFEVLGSFATVELTKPDTDGDFLSWENIYMNYVYVLIDEHADAPVVQAGLNKVCQVQNALLKDRRIDLGLQPLKDVTTGHPLENPIGPAFPMPIAWILAGLAFVVIASACFNYTNLSIARALRRSREVGIRKIVGAYKRQVLLQFMIEAVVIAVLALLVSFGLFFFLRRQFILLDPHIGNMVSLMLSARMVVYFILLAVATGMLAGIVPALLFSRIQIVQAMKDASGLRLFRAVNMRKALIVVQYVFSLVFITGTMIGYSQYKSFLAYDLGFKTENIINIRLQGNNGDRIIDELRALPMVTDVSRSLMVTSLGSIFGASAKYKDPEVSVAVQQNMVDQRYVLLHGHQLIAGRNFNWKPDSAVENEVLVNEQLLRRFGIAGGDPLKALGEELTIEDRKLTIVGVLKDFHYGTILHQIEPTVLRYQPGTYYPYANVKINTKDLPGTLAAIEAVWKKIDRKHPLDARFYDDQIAEAYAQFSVMVRVIGFLGFLAVCIASLGLLGMVVFTTETKLKEISIRKVLGASEGNLVVLLSRSFLLLLFIAAAIALPVTYLFFDRVVLLKFAYHDPISWLDMVMGLAGVLIIAGAMIGTQTLKVARTNPAATLKAE
jgi:putative ABC transport system permease protein